MPEATLPLSVDELELTRRPLERASQLPPAAYTDDAVFAWELENFFLKGWVNACHADQVSDRGQYVKVDIGNESILVVADDDGIPRAFVNSCRHRGARVVDEPEGKVMRLQCPYHAWSYGFDGSLKNAPHTEKLEDFDKSCYGLRPVRLAVVEGLVFLDLAGDAPPATEVVGDLTASLAHYTNGELRRGGRVVYDVAANWKAIIENYSECLHCPGVHPELNRLSHYMSGEEQHGDGLWTGGSMTLSDDADTMALEGGHATARPPIEGLTPEEIRSVYYYAIFPNCLVSLHPDYVMLHTLWPKSPGRTEVICEWFFEPSTMERHDFDPSDAVGFWDMVNRQDWEVCELTQRGIGGRDVTAGRYTQEEGNVHEFDVIVADRYLEALARTESAR